MTTLEALMSIAAEAAPDYTIECGFYQELVDYLNSTTISGPTLYVAIGPDFPASQNNTNGRFDSFESHFGILIYMGTPSQDSNDLYRQYIDLRDAFNGKRFVTDTGDKTSVITSSDMRSVTGMMHANISLAVV